MVVEKQDVGLPPTRLRWHESQKRLGVAAAVGAIGGCGDWSRVARRPQPSLSTPTSVTPPMVMAVNMLVAADWSWAVAATGRRATGLAVDGEGCGRR